MRNKYKQNKTMKINISPELGKTIMMVANYYLERENYKTFKFHITLLNLK